MEQRRFYDIKDAARHLDVAPSTLRYWEREGLVHADRNSRNEYRRYALHDLIDASEVAFYRRLGVPVRELKAYRDLSARELDDALARTEADIDRRLAELRATRRRLARQRVLDARMLELERAGMHGGAPAIEGLRALDYDSPESWNAMTREPWSYGVFVDAREPDVVHEAIVEPAARDGLLWTRSARHTPDSCRACLLRVDPASDKSNARELFGQAARTGADAGAIVGSYLVTASEDGLRWDYFQAWTVP